VQLRKLKLHGLSTGKRDDDDANQKRLLAWLSQPRSAPLLSSVELCEGLDDFMWSRADELFSHLALREGLRQLLLGDRRFARGIVVSQRAIYDLVSSTIQASGNTLYRSSTGYSDANQQWLRQPCRPFQQLTHLRVAVDCGRSVVRLTPYLASVRRLSLAIVRRVPRDAEPRAIFCALAALLQLQALHLQIEHYAPVSGADVVLLARLTQLRDLRLVVHDEGQVDDAHLATLLAPMRGLRTLALGIDISAHSHEAVGVIGEACPQLRHLTLWSDQVLHLAPSLESATKTPLFAHLEYLDVPFLDSADDTQLR
jgi:hypothetical protein